MERDDQKSNLVSSTLSDSQSKWKGLFSSQEFQKSNWISVSTHVWTYYWIFSFSLLSYFSSDFFTSNDFLLLFYLSTDREDTHIKYERESDVSPLCLRYTLPLDWKLLVTCFSSDVYFLCRLFLWLLFSISDSIWHLRQFFFVSVSNSTSNENHLVFIDFEDIFFHTIFLSYLPINQMFKHLFLFNSKFCSNVISTEKLN